MCENHDVTEPQITPLQGMHRRDLVKRLWSGAMVIGVVTSTAGCASVSKYLEPSDADLAPMAAEAWAQTKAATPISKDPAANARLLRIGQKIAAVAPVQNAQWEFVVFDTKDLNAFVLPGGKVGFYKGLLDFVDNDDQVAAVLGHEVGHVVARHAAKRAGRESATQLGVQLGGALGGDQTMAILGAGAAVGVTLPFSRENESEADKLGVDYMRAAGYDVKQSVKLWEKMAAASGSRSPEFMSTHPNPETRIKDLKAYIEAKGYATF